MPFRGPFCKGFLSFFLSLLRAPSAPDIGSEDSRLHPAQFTRIGSHLMGSGFSPPHISPMAISPRHSRPVVCTHQAIHMPRNFTTHHIIPRVPFPGIVSDKTQLWWSPTDISPYSRTASPPLNPTARTATPSNSHKALPKQYHPL